jgi:hypothetical protein
LDPSRRHAGHARYGDRHATDVKGVNMRVMRVGNTEAS